MLSKKSISGDIKEGEERFSYKEWETHAMEVDDEQKGDKDQFV